MVEALKQRSPGATSYASTVSRFAIMPWGVSNPHRPFCFKMTPCFHFGAFCNLERIGI